MARVAVVFQSLVFLFLFTTSAAHTHQQCFSRFVNSIPSKHLFHQKSKPLVIGHRGNPRRFQENTLDSFTSLLETNADGFELDIYLTKDEKLVVFHDDNTKYLTGESHTMWEMNAADLTKVYIKTSINYNGNVYNYTKRRPIPMLKDVLEAMKGTSKLMYLEIKPSRTRDMTESTKVGRAVAKMVTEMGLVNDVFINSFDPFKTLAARRANPKITVGFFYTSNYWKTVTFPPIRETWIKLPDMKECVTLALNGTEFIKHMFDSGAALKAINASFLDMDYKIYDNPLYSNDTFKTLRSHYSPNISSGAWTLYSMKLTKKDDDKQDAVIDNLVRHGAERLITDDVYRMLGKLKRPPTPTPVAPTSSGVLLTSHLLGFLLLSLFVFF